VRRLEAFPEPVEGGGLDAQLGFQKLEEAGFASLHLGCPGDGRYQWSHFFGLENISLMPGKNAKKLLDEGKSISASLSAADTEQNRKGIPDLPTAMLDFYELKARLNPAVKVINDAGHELYADNANKSGLFNLHILHRPAGRKKSEPASVKDPSSAK
jgi:hypothetical protein